jgi:FkbM family methyltransferase
MFNLKKKQVLVQIGTANGNDEFLEIAKYAKASKIILVEPFDEMREVILKNYEGIKNIYLESVAITEVNKGMVKLVHPTKKKDWRKEPLYNSCFSLVPMDDWGNNFKEKIVPSMSFMELCEKYNLTHIHYLQTDCEGYDTEILKSIDFNKITIDIIKYEDWSFPMSNYTRHGEEGLKYGINGMRKVAKILTELGYTLSKDKTDIVAIKENAN